MSSAASGEDRRRCDDEDRKVEPHLFHGDEEFDECAPAPAPAPSEEPPPSGEDLVEEGGHIPSQEEWLGNTSSDEESLEDAAEEQEEGEAARRRHALRDEDR